MPILKEIPLPVKPLPRLGVGTWHGKSGETGSTGVASIVYEALKLGYRLVDTAAFYNCETMVGEGIKKALDEGIVKRDDIYVISKLWNCYHAKEHVEPALRRTLKDLQLDYVDQYLIHWPISVKYIPMEETYPPPMTFDEVPVPLSETWKALEECVDKGLTRAIGVSNFEVQLLRELLKTCRIKPQTNQIEIHPFLHQPQVVNFCVKNGIGITAYSAFGGTTFVEYGVVSDKELLPPQHPVIVEMAKAKGVSPHQVILAWVLNICPLTSVIPRSSRVSNLENNMKAFNIPMTDDDMKKISALDSGRRFNDMKYWVPMETHVFGA